MLADLKYAVRWLRRSPGFAAVAVLSLGLGIGANTAMFALVDAVLLRPIPVRDPGSLVDVFTSSGDGDHYATSSYPDLLDLKAQNTVFSDMTGYTPMFAPLSLGDRARLVMGQVVTANHFNLLGVTPLLGRMLQPSDDEPGAARVVVIGHRLWSSDFGRDPAIVGKTLQLRGLPYTVVGVAPASFTGVIPLFIPELWLPVAHVEEVEAAGINDNIPSPTGRTQLERRGSRFMFVKGRLRQGVTAATAHANVALIGTQLARTYPETNRTRVMSAFATNDVRLLVPQAGGPLSMGSAGVMAVVGLVLLIACANVAGMLLARASSRNREISVRLAIGASRWQIVRQMMSEGLVLGLCGAAIAAAIAWTLVRLLVSIRLPIPGSMALDIRLDLRVLGFAVVIAVVAGLLAALTPALKASSLRLAGDLRGEIGAAQVGGRRWALRDLLVVGQLALTAVLLVVAGLLLRSLGASQSADVGFRTGGIAALATDTDMVRYPAERADQFWQETLQRLERLPGVEAAALVTPRMLFDVNFTRTSIRIDGKAYAEDDRGEIVSNVAVTPGYFGLLEIPFVEGRNFTDADRKGAPLVAIINQTMARRYWPEGSALGRTFQMSFGDKQKYEVIGVVKDHRLHTVSEQPAPYLHLAAAQRSLRYSYAIARTGGDASQLLAAAFGGVGTLLAAIGLYGVIAFSVVRRTREIGIRMAIGAERRDVLRLVMRQGLSLAAVGAAVGVCLAAVVASVLSSVLYGVGSFDPAAWGAAIAVLGLSVAAANFIPARRAMRVSPITALRAE